MSQETPETRFAAFVVRRRKEWGETQEGVSRKLDVSQGTVSRWERAASLPEEKDRPRVYEFFRISRELIDGPPKNMPKWEISIPVVGIIEAGAPSKPSFPTHPAEMSRNLYDNTVPDNLPPESVFCLRVHGPALEPDFCDQGMVYVSSDPRAAKGSPLRQRRFPVVKVRQGLYRVLRDGLRPGQKAAGWVVGIYCVA